MRDESRVRAFLDDVIAVCRKHRMVLTPEGYDRLQVWQLEGENARELGFLAEAEDCTNVLPSQNI